VELRDPQTAELCYVSDSNNTGAMVIREAQAPSGAAALTLAEPPAKNPFASFEDPPCMSFWADNRGQIQKVLFSRLNLTLLREIDVKTNQERWVVAGQKEWHVAPEQFIPHFGQSTGFLLLENDKGQKKALFPVWNPIHAEKRALNFPYTYDFQAKKKEQGRTVECDIAHAKVVPKTAEARFYLARIYLEKGLVDQAEELIFSPHAEVTSRKLSESERELLKSIALKPESGDIGTLTLKARMQALYILEKNDAQFPEARELLREVEFSYAKLQFFADYGGGRFFKEALEQQEFGARGKGCNMA
jgi:hypothetical protein